MVNWPAGHRWEDYQVRIYDKATTYLGALGSVYKLRGSTARFGQYGTNLTCSLEFADPWVSILKEAEVHFVEVLRDGTHIWSGYQIKLDRTDEIATDDQWVEFEFLPLARILYWRIGYEAAPGDLTITGVKVDDAFKDIVGLTMGGNAPVTPTNSIALEWSPLAIAADKTEHPDSPDLDASGYNIYEFLQEFGRRYDVDWDVYFLDGVPTFQTWYPRRGLDRTEGNGSNAECIFSDAEGNITKQRYGWDASDHCNVIFDGGLAKEVIAGGAIRDSWLVRCGSIEDTGDKELQVERSAKEVKEWYSMEAFAEGPSKAWGTAFDIGDQCTWISHRLGYGPYNDTLGRIEFAIDEDGFEALSLVLGDEEPDFTDRLRGGGMRGAGPGHTKKKAWKLTDDAGDWALADRDNAVGVVGDSGPITSTVDAGTLDTIIIALADTAVTPATYGDATHVGQFTADQQGRLTAASDVLITGTTPAAHNLLSAQHGDTVIGAAARGDLIWVGSGGNWHKQAVGAGNSVLTADGTDVAWDTSPTVSRLNVDTTNNYLDYSSGFKFVSAANFQFWVGGVATYLMGAGTFKPESGIHTNLGTSADRWEDIYVAGAKGLKHADGNTSGYVWRCNGTRGLPAALQAGDIPDISATYVPLTRQVVAGDGLTGGGALSSDVTITMGTPDTLTAATSNAVTATSHTHAITGFTASTVQVIAGLGLIGGGALSSDVTVQIGLPATLTAATTNGRTTTSHTHAITNTADGNADVNMLLKTDASGYLRTAGFYVGAGGDYFRSATYAKVSGDSGVSLAVSGTNYYVATTSSFAAASGSPTLGTSGSPWTNIYGSALNIAGDITVSGTVDGVDISTHTHSFSDNAGTGNVINDTEGGDSHNHLWPTGDPFVFYTDYEGYGEEWYHRHSIAIDADTHGTSQSGRHHHSISGTTGAPT